MSLYSFHVTIGLSNFLGWTSAVAEAASCETYKILKLVCLPMDTGDGPGLDERRVEVQVVRPAHQRNHHMLSCSTRAMLAQKTSMNAASLQGSVHVLQAVLHALDSFQASGLLPALKLVC